MAEYALQFVGPNIEDDISPVLFRPWTPNTLILLLSDPRVNLSQFDAQGRMPLVLAIQNKWVTLVRNLLSKERVDVDWRDKYGQSVADYARQHGQKRIGELLCKLAQR